MLNLPITHGRCLVSNVDIHTPIVHISRHSPLFSQPKAVGKYIVTPRAELSDFLSQCGIGNLKTQIAVIDDYGVLQVIEPLYW